MLSCRDDLMLCRRALLSPAFMSVVRVFGIKVWRAPIRWSGLSVSASWVSGPSERCFPAQAEATPSYPKSRKSQGPLGAENA